MNVNSSIICRVEFHLKELFSNSDIFKNYSIIERFDLPISERDFQKWNKITFAKAKIAFILSITIMIIII